MHTVWILVCDAAKARFFETSGANPAWHLVNEVFHEASKSKAAELAGDRSGSRSSEGGSVHHNALAPASSPRDVEKGHFAHSLGDMLDQAMRSARFRRWVLVAPPHFAGVIAKELTPELKKHLLATVEMDLGHLDARELAEKLGHTARIPVDQQDSIREPKKRSH